MPLSRLPSGGAHWVDHVTRHAHAVPDRAAIRFGGEPVTWRQLDAMIGSTTVIMPTAPTTR
jgi:hypothetical protein